MSTTISVVCYKSKVLKNNESPLMLRICKDGKRKYESIGISILPSSSTLMTAAPAPSPNKIHVPLSLQLTILDSHSTPINTAFYESPALICPAAIWNATINHEHDAFKSNAAAFTAPSFF